MSAEPIGSVPFQPGGASALWLAQPPEVDYPVLTGRLTVDVAVVGGGIVGLTAALLLKRAGVKVALIEAGRIGGGVSGHTTAKITVAHGLKYDGLIRSKGRERAAQYAAANQAALDFMIDCIRENRIACDLQRMFACTYTCRPEMVADLQVEAVAAASLGLPVVYRDNLDLPFKVEGALQYAHQACFHPVKYLRALGQMVQGGDGAVYENSRVTHIHEGRRTCRLSTAGAQVRAGQVIVATHFPILDRGLLFAKMAPFRSYLMAARTGQPPPEGMYINAETPRRTFRSHTDDDGRTLLLVGGENHAVGRREDTREPYRRVETFARRYFDVKAVLHRWSTQDNEPVDQVPFIGRHSAFSRRLHVATGMQGWGMTNGTAAGMILADLLTGRTHPHAAVFDPGRSAAYFSSGFFKHNLQVARTFLGGLAAGAVHGKKAAIPAAEAPSANAADASPGVRGETSRPVSRHCSHMGCRLTWNTAEESWDCPCHGSRFSAGGGILHAPARKPLARPGHKTPT